MRPAFSLLDPVLAARVLDEAFQLLMEPGVRVHEPEAAALLAAAGADVRDGTARIPERYVLDLKLKKAKLRKVETDVVSDWTVCAAARTISLWRETNEC